MDNLLHVLNELNLEEKKIEEEIYLEFLNNIGITSYTTQQYKTFLSRLFQIYNLCTGGEIDIDNTIFLSKDMLYFKYKTCNVSKEVFFDILLHSSQVYLNNTNIRDILLSDSPYKILKEISWINF